MSKEMQAQLKTYKVMGYGRNRDVEVNVQAHNPRIALRIAKKQQPSLRRIADVRVHVKGGDVWFVVSGGLI